MISNSYPEFVTRIVSACRKIRGSLACCTPSLFPGMEANAEELASKNCDLSGGFAWHERRFAQQISQHFRSSRGDIFT